MILSDYTKGRPFIEGGMDILKTSQAKQALEDLLLKSDFDRQAPKANIILDTFMEFLDLQVDCSRDDFFFQCGVFDFTGERLFYWDFVRQFMIEGNNVYSHMEQLHFEVKYEPNTELEEFLIIEWCIGDKNEYFEKIRNLDEFNIPLEKYVPVSIDIYQEVV